MTVDEDCGCKGKPKLSRGKVFLLRDDNSLNRPRPLVDVLSFTEKQAETAIKFSENRGECLIFAGPLDESINILERLAIRGINCEVRPGSIK